MQLIDRGQNELYLDKVYNHKGYLSLSFRKHFKSEYVFLSIGQTISHGTYQMKAINRLIRLVYLMTGIQQVTSDWKPHISTHFGKSGIKLIKKKLLTKVKRRSKIKMIGKKRHIKVINQDLKYLVKERNGVYINCFLPAKLLDEKLLIALFWDLDHENIVEKNDCFTSVYDKNRNIIKVSTEAFFELEDCTMSDSCIDGLIRKDL